MSQLFLYFIVLPHQAELTTNMVRRFTRQILMKRSKSNFKLSYFTA